MYYVAIAGALGGPDTAGSGRAPWRSRLLVSTTVRGPRSLSGSRCSRTVQAGRRRRTMPDRGLAAWTSYTRVDGCRGRHFTSIDRVPPAVRGCGTATCAASRRFRPNRHHIAALLVSARLRHGGPDRAGRQSLGVCGQHRWRLRSVEARPSQRWNCVAQRRRRVHFRQPAVSRTGQEKPRPCDERSTTNTGRPQAKGSHRLAVEAGLRAPRCRLVGSFGSDLE